MSRKQPRNRAAGRGALPHGQQEQPASKTGNRGGVQQNAACRMISRRSRWLEHGGASGAAVCGLLLLAVGLVFGQTVRHEFVNYDDDAYVYKNVQVARGLTAQGIAWVFSHSHASNWHPLTSMSHMLDCQLYGLAPADTT